MTRTKLREALRSALEDAIRDTLIISFSCTGLYLAVTMYLIH